LKSGSLNLLEPSGSVEACNGTALFICFTLVYSQMSVRDWEGGQNNDVVKQSGFLHVSSKNFFIKCYNPHTHTYNRNWHVSLALLRSSLDIVIQVRLSHVVLA
jgi:hypothetical protein